MKFSHWSLFVGNLPNNFSRDELISMFAKIGDVKNCTYFFKKCFIDYNTTDECDKAIATYNGCIFGSENNKILVKYSDNSKERLQKLNIEKSKPSVDDNASDTSTLNISDCKKTNVDSKKTSTLTKSNNISTKKATTTVVPSSKVPLEKVDCEKVVAKPKCKQSKPKNKLPQVNGVVSDNIKIETNVIETLDMIESKINGPTTPVTLDINDIFKTADVNSAIITFAHTINISTDTATTTIVSSMIPLKKEENCQKALQKLNSPTPKNKCVDVNGVFNNTNLMVENGPEKTLESTKDGTATNLNV